MPQDGSWETDDEIDEYTFIVWFKCKVGSKLRNHRLFSISVAKISVFVPPPLSVGYSIHVFSFTTKQVFNRGPASTPEKMMCSSKQLPTLSPLSIGCRLSLVTGAARRYHRYSCVVMMKGDE
jgi:hypothetical protein